ncbi:MAG: cytochrome c-type biogenesis protein CcmH [Polyangiaceae bacterium]|nr:cytochrome c-type biogenesis protein CcmH [Polyangiaceae bacterium]
MLFTGVGLSKPLPAFSAEPSAATERPAKGEAALLGRLVAPCCWTQTLDVHAGPQADALRAEVRARLVAGESAHAIETDLVARYGSRILAEPPGQPLPWVGVGFGVLSLAAAGALVIAIRRWTRRSDPALAPGGAALPTSPSQRDADDERLDEELRLLDN